MSCALLNRRTNAASGHVLKEGGPEIVRTEFGFCQVDEVEDNQGNERQNRNSDENHRGSTIENIFLEGILTTGGKKVAGRGQEDNGSGRNDPWETAASLFNHVCLNVCRDTGDESLGVKKRSRENSIPSRLSHIGNASVEIFFERNLNNWRVLTNFLFREAGGEYNVMSFHPRIAVEAMNQEKGHFDEWSRGL